MKMTRRTVLKILGLSPLGAMLPAPTAPKMINLTIKFNKDKFNELIKMHVSKCTIAACEEIRQMNYKMRGYKIAT